MNSRKKILIVLVALILIITVILIIIVDNYRRSKYGNEYEKNEDESDIKINYEYEKLDSYTLFFTVSNCVQKYFDFISLDLNDYKENVEYKTKQDELGIYTEEEKKQAIYDILDKEYIQNNKVNLDNIYEHINKLDTESEFIPLEMGMIDGDRVQRFCVNGKIKDESIYIIVNLDYYNMTYSVEPILKNSYSSINEIELESKSYEIKENVNNNFDYLRLDDGDIAREYLNDYKMNAIENPDMAYNLLDEEYRDKRFENIDEYKKYISENKDVLSSGIIDKFNISEKDGYTQYVILDTNGNYYIFKVTGIMEYTAITDFYTIDLEEIMNKYDKSNVQERVAINIQKVVSAINNSDYKYVYGKLAKEFRENKYSTLEEFENYISERINGIRMVSFGEFNNEGEIYIYKITLTDNSTGTSDPVNMQIIMQLKEDRDFVMSFNIDE